jgi:hypothetical protein
LEIEAPEIVEDGPAVAGTTPAQGTRTRRMSERGNAMFLFMFTLGFYIFGWIIFILNWSDAHRDASPWILVGCGTVIVSILGCSLLKPE